MPCVHNQNQPLEQGGDGGGIIGTDALAAYSHPVGQNPHILGPKPAQNVYFGARYGQETIQNPFLAKNPYFAAKRRGGM